VNGVGVVAIGRNEGQRLRRCLESVAARGMPVVYVDSASSDGSVEVARSLGAEVVELDLSLPFSAARARNAGFERLVQVTRGVKFVQFVDGDCEVDSRWIERAAAELEARADVAVVCGRRRERFPEASVYNRLADLEWDTPVGEAKSCGGDAMMRADSFREVGGFDASIAAGEEPELCQRLRGKGYKVLRIDAEMTLHDSAMLHFGQWWKRAVRSGYGAADVANRFGHQGLFVHHVRSARRWVIGWTACLSLAASLPCALVMNGVSLGRSLAWAGIAAGFVAAALLVQMLRLAVKVRGRVSDWKTAIAYGVLIMVGKWANFRGQGRYFFDRLGGKNTRLIEYKASCATPITKPT
jgi:glycosyltransferase involved in cell wall biosynthesis